VDDRLPEPGCWVLVVKDRANPRNGRRVAAATLVSDGRGTGFKLAAERTYYAPDWSRVGLAHWHPDPAARYQGLSLPPRERPASAAGPQQESDYA
jgi:hypothetical protein